MIGAHRPMHDPGTCTVQMRRVGNRPCFATSPRRVRLFFATAKHQGIQRRQAAIGIGAPRLAVLIRVSLWSGELVPK